MAPGELEKTAADSGAALAEPKLAPRWSPPKVGPQGSVGQPLTPAELNTLDEVIAAAERSTGLRFAVYLGDLGADTRATAETLFAGLGTERNAGVLVALSPAQKTVEVVTGGEGTRRIGDRSARLGVLSVMAAAADGDIVGALVNGVRTLADQAGALPERASW